MDERFLGFFRSQNATRDKLLARMFGLFSESIVRQWCACPEAPYEDLGRPTLYAPANPRGLTLDFTLRHRASGRVYVAELKCELKYEGYRYLRLEEPWQLDHHKTPAFGRFLAAARTGHDLDVRVGGTSRPVDGAVLVWGAMIDEGREAVRQRYGFADVLSVERMVGDLQRWIPEQWTEEMRALHRWSSEMFEFLIGRSSMDPRKTDRA